MNVQERLLKELIDRGLNRKNAETILNLSLPELNKQAREVNGVDEDEKPNSPYKITWESPSTDYDDTIYNLWFSLIVKPIALKWIIKYAPEAWFKTMFQ